MAVPVLFMTAAGGTAAADKCRKQQKRLAEGLSVMHRFAEKAMITAVGCTFQGPDDAAVARTAKQAIAAYRKLVRLAPETTTDCTRRNPEVVLSPVSHWVGERLGAVYGLCSSQAERIVQLNVSEEERKRLLEPHVQRYIRDVLARAGMPAPPP